MAHKSTDAAGVVDRGVSGSTDLTKLRFSARSGGLCGVRRRPTAGEPRDVDRIGIPCTGAEEPGDAKPQPLCHLFVADRCGLLFGHRLFFLDHSLIKKEVST